MERVTTASLSTPPLGKPSKLASIKRVSSPITPPTLSLPGSERSRTPSTDSSPIDELSFDFTFDANGQYIRFAKSVNSSPPTPQEEHKELESDGYKDMLQQPVHKPPSPNFATGRVSFARSEKQHAERPSLSSNLPPTSSRLMRVASVPPASTTAPSNDAPPLRQTSSMTAGPSRRLDRPQRVTLEEFREQEERNRRQIEELNARIQDEVWRGKPEESDILLAEHEAGVAMDHQRHQSRFETPQLGASRPLASGLTAAASTSKSARSARGVSGAGGAASARGRPPSYDGVSAPDPPRERTNARQPQIMSGSHRAVRALRASSSTKYGSGTSAAAAIWVDAPEAEGAELDYGTYGHKGFEAQVAETDWLGDEADPGGNDPYQQPAAAHELHTARQRSRTGSTLTQSKSGGTRPRRSASFSAAQDFPLENAYSSIHNTQPSHTRPVTSLGLQANRPVTNEKGPSPPRRLRETKPQSSQSDRYQHEYEAADRRAQAVSQEQEHSTPSPTHTTRQQLYQQQQQQQQQQQRSAHVHQQRYGSDALRTSKSQSQIASSSSTSPPPSNPTGEALPARLSPSARGISSGGVLTNGAPLLNGLRQSHRRSPTAPPAVEAPATGVGGSGTGKGKAWVSGDWAGVGTSTEERDGFAMGVDEYGVNLGGGLVPGSSKSLPVRTSRQPQSKSSAPVANAFLQAHQNTRNHMMVNKKAYIRLEVIGKGGSSRVFRVMNAANEIYAIKRVSLDKTDAETMSGYMNEIALLKRLDGNHRIIRLFDSELKAGPGGTKGHLLLVMEYGEIDLAKLLLEQQKEPFNMVWISYYWQQMLQAVHVIHEEKIVHSDLKPANFVLVRGQLKLIDFGIANAIANDTTNIQRDHQIGTVNYMSPEAIELPDGMRRLKVGRPSDVWSLGCILYQMVYGQPPFQHLSVLQKMKAIPDSSHVIDFPEYSTPSIPVSPQGPATAPQKLEHLARPVRRDVIQGIKSCFCRNPKERCTIPELMEQKWLAYEEPEPPKPPNIKSLLRPDETVINYHYMAQLLSYGMKMGSSRKAAMSNEELLSTAERLVEELQSLNA